MKLEDTDSNVIKIRTKATNMACQTTEDTQLKAGSPIESNCSERRKSPMEGRRKSDAMPTEEITKPVNRPQTDITRGKKKQPQEWPPHKEAYDENHKVRVKPYDAGGECTSSGGPVTNKKPSPSESEAGCDLSKEFSTKLNLSDAMDKAVDQITSKTKKLEIKSEQDNSDNQKQGRLIARKPPGVPVYMQSYQSRRGFEIPTAEAFDIYKQERKRGREIDTPMFTKGFKGSVKEPVENSDSTPLTDEDLNDLGLLFNTPPHITPTDTSVYTTGYHNGYEQSLPWSNTAANVDQIKAYLYRNDREPPKPKYSLTPNQPYHASGITGPPVFCSNGIPQLGNAYTNNSRSGMTQSSRSMGRPEAIRSHDQRYYSVDSSPVSAYSADSSPAPSPDSESTVTTYSVNSPAGTSVYPSSPDSVYSRDSETAQSPDSGYSHTVPSPDWTPGSESSIESCLYTNKPYCSVQSDVTTVKDVADSIKAHYGLIEGIGHDTTYREVPSYVNSNTLTDVQNVRPKVTAIPAWYNTVPDFEANLSDNKNKYTNPDDFFNDFEDFVIAEGQAVVSDAGTQRPLPTVPYPLKPADSLYPPEVAPVVPVSQTVPKPHPYINPTSTVATVCCLPVAVASNPRPILPAPCASTTDSATHVSVQSSVPCTTAAIIVPAPTVPSFVFVPPVTLPAKEKQIMDKYPRIQPHPGPTNRNPIAAAETTGAVRGSVKLAPQNTPPRNIIKAVRHQPEKVMKSRTPDAEMTRLNKARTYICKLSTEDLIKEDKDGDMLLQTAIVMENPYIFQALLERLHREGLLAQTINHHNNRKQTAVYLAVAGKNLAMVSALVQRGCDVNIQAIKPVTNQSPIYRGPLHYAAERGVEWLPVLEVLLQSDSLERDRTNSEGQTALHCAVTAHGKHCGDAPDGMIIDSKPTIKLLVDNNARLDYKDGKSGKTPLHYVIEKKDLDLLTFVMRQIHKEDMPQLLQQATFDSNNSLHLAVGLHFTDFQEHKRLIRMLMENGADASLKNSKDQPKNVICSAYNMEQKREILEILAGCRIGSLHSSATSPNRQFPPVASPPLLPATVPTTVGDLQ